MTYDELLERVSEYISSECDCESCQFINGPYKALRGVLELHKPSLRIEPTSIKICDGCQTVMLWESCPTIQAIEKELQ